MSRIDGERGRLQYFSVQRGMPGGFPGGAIGFSGADAGGSAPANDGPKIEEIEFTTILSLISLTLSLSKVL